MENLIICVGMFYILHLFLTMSLSLHKVPFINWTYTGGDISGMTELSKRMTSASDNLRQSLPLFLISETINSCICCFDKFSNLLSIPPTTNFLSSFKISWSIEP